MAKHRYQRPVAWMLSVALLSCAGAGGGPVRPALAAGAAPVLSDMKGHWSAAMVAQATADGWVNGYPDRTFRPDAQVSRAELVKMMVSASKLPAVAPPSTRVFDDTEHHWVEQQGYLYRATGYGVIDGADYAYIFGPDQPATRLVTTIMAVKLLGRQASVAAATSADVNVADSGSLPAWSLGWVRQALADGMLTGYPDGSFRAQRAVTRAEAVAIVQRTMTAMTAGVDPALRLAVNGKEVLSPVPLAVRNGQVYAPVQALYGPDSFVVNWTDSQGVLPGNGMFRDSLAEVGFPTGASYGWVLNANPQAAERQVRKPLAAPSYRLYGEVMVPVAAVGGSGSVPYLTATHDAAAGRVAVQVQADWPGNALPASAEAVTFCGAGASGSGSILWPEQSAPLLAAFLCDAQGRMVTPTRPVFVTATVDPNGPLRLRERPDAPPVAQLRLQIPDAGGDSQVFVPEDPAAPVAEGNFSVTYTAPGGSSAAIPFEVSDPRPYRLGFEPIAPGAVGQPQMVKFRVVDRRDRQRGSTGPANPATDPALTITGPDGHTVPAELQVTGGSGNSRYSLANGVATFTWTPPGSGKYRLEAGLPGGPGSQALHGSADVTIP